MTIDFQQLTDSIREESQLDVKGSFPLGQLEKVEKVHEIVLDETTNDAARAGIYN